MIYVMSHSVCDLYDRVPYDLVAFFIAFLKDLDYLTVTRRLIVNVHDCIVKIGVECLTVGFYLFDAELSERFVKALESQRKPAGKGLGVLATHCTVKVVKHGKQRAYRIRIRIGVNPVLFLCRAAAEVIVLRKHTQILVVVRFF